MEVLELQVWPRGQEALEWARGKSDDPAEAEVVDLWNSRVTDINAIDAHLRAALVSLTSSLPYDVVFVCLMTWYSIQGGSVVLTHGDDFAAHMSRRTTERTSSVLTLTRRCAQRLGVS